MNHDMSKYENEHFVNMKISIFLIIGFTHFVFCCDLNITHDSVPVCPFNNKLFRRKRDVAEYTRWRANAGTTPEFIVKVLDEDLTTPRQKKIVAINIQPITKGVEKIIIGGAMVSMPTSVRTSTEMIKDYTRFVPPTTTGAQIEGDGYLSPAQTPPVMDIEQFIAMLPRGRNPQRDESPPSGPQFLTRNPSAMRQYAPITPVGFTRRTIIGPLTPPPTTTREPYNFRKSLPHTQATNSFEDDILIPTRSQPNVEEFGKFLPFENSAHSFMPTTSIEYTTKQHTTTLTSEEPINDFESSTSTNKAEYYTLKQLEKNDDSEKKPYDKDPEAAYSMTFYNYDDNEVDTKNIESNHDADTDKIKDHESQNDNYTKLENSPSLATNTVLADQEDNDLDKEPDNSMNIPVKLLPNLSSLEMVTETSEKDTIRDKRRKICSMEKLRPLSFNSPRTLPEIVTQLKQWAEESPVAKWIDITDGNYTAMENPIYMMKVDDPSSGQILSAKQTVMIVAGIQGRDHHAVTAAMYVLYQLIERSTAHPDLLTKYRFWIIPVFNPDGYNYAMTFPHRRDWTKNLRQNWDVCKGRASCHSCEAYGLRCTIQPCYGVNLDRNFEYQWIPTTELDAAHPCGPLYAGVRQLSEVETHAFTEFLHDQKHTQIFSFIAFKEGDVLGVMYPYSHTRKKGALDQVHRQRASRAAAAAFSISGRPYVAGQTSEFLPLYAGGIEDWVDSHLGISNTYTIMMFRPSDTYNPKIMTERIVHEAYAAMDTLVLQSGEPHLTNNPAQVNIMSRSSSEVITACDSDILLAFITVRICFR